MSKTTSAPQESKAPGLATLDFSGEQLRRDKDGRFSLNDLHRMDGAPVNREPKEWLKLESTKALVEVLQYQLDQTGGKSPRLEVLKAKASKGGGTWAIRALALAYAKYLSPEFHAACLKVIEDRIEEEANPELAITRGMERAERRYRLLGRDQQWIAKRIKSICTRNIFTSFAGGRGCITPDHFRQLTNATYTGVAGLTAREWRERKKISEGANLRDHMSLRELAAVELAEALAMEVVERDHLYGPEPLAMAANRAGFEVQKCVRGALGGAA